MRFKKILDMPEKCEVCQQRFEPEPGFYYGAMFLSYIMTALFFLTVGALLVWVGGMELNKAFLIMILIGGLTFIPFIRFARSLWIHIIVPYDPATASLKEN